MAEKVIDDKYLMIDAIKSEYPGISERGIAAIMGNIQLESAGGKFGREIPQTYESIWSKGKSLRSMQGNITDYYNSIGITNKKKQKEAYNKLVKENPESALGIAYMEDPNSSFAGGTGPLQLTIADYGKMKDRPEKFKALMLDSGFEGTFSEYMGRINTDPAFGLKETIRFYKKHGSKKRWSVDSLNNTTAKELGDTVINPGRDWITNEKWQVYQTAGNDSIADYNTNYLPTIVTAVPDGDVLTQAEKDQITIDIQPTPGPIVSDMGPTVLNQIEVDKNNAKLKKLEEEERKNKISQPKELIPLADLSEEEIGALTNKQREKYGLQPTVDVVGEKETTEEIKAKQKEKEQKEAEEEKEQIEQYSKESIEKDKQKEKEVKQSEVIETQVVEKQELEKIKPIATQEMEVLDANGNVKKITVPMVQPITPKKEEVIEEEVIEEKVVEKEVEEVVEEKPKLTKPSIRDFKTSGDYVRARMKYYKSIEDEEDLANDDELSDEEIKESVDMEQNSKVIDASKRNIFKTNGKNNIFNSIIGDIDTMAKGVQQELNKFNKSLNNRD